MVVSRAVLDSVGGFADDLPFVDDWDLWLRIARVSEARHVPRPLMRYRVHGLNASRDYRRMWRGSVRVLWRHRRARPWRGVARMGQIYGAQAFDAFRQTRRPTHLAWAIGLWPGHVGRQVLRRVCRGRSRPGHRC